MLDESEFLSTRGERRKRKKEYPYKLVCGYRKKREKEDPAGHFWRNSKGGGKGGGKMIESLPKFIIRRERKGKKGSGSFMNLVGSSGREEKREEKKKSGRPPI